MYLSGISVPEQMNAAWVADRVRDTPAVKEIVAQVMEGHARYPSQLYEAFAEGVVLFAILWFIRVKFPACLERRVLRRIRHCLCHRQNRLRGIPGT